MRQWLMTICTFHLAQENVQNESFFFCLASWTKTFFTQSLHHKLPQLCASRLPLSHPVSFYFFANQFTNQSISLWFILSSSYATENSVSEQINVRLGQVKRWMGQRTNFPAQQWNQWSFIFLWLLSLTFIFALSCRPISLNMFHTITVTAKFMQICLHLMRFPCLTAGSLLLWRCIKDEFRLCVFHCIWNLCNCVWVYSITTFEEQQQAWYYEAIKMSLLFASEQIIRLTTKSESK